MKSASVAGYSQNREAASQLPCFILIKLNRILSSWAKKLFELGMEEMSADIFDDSLL